MINILKKIRNYFRRPKCPNGYQCGDCIHSKWFFGEGKCQGFICKIDAR